MQSLYIGLDKGWLGVLLGRHKHVAVGTGLLTYDQDIPVYPIVSVWRQYVDLMLKHFIFEGNLDQGQGPRSNILAMHDFDVFGQLCRPEFPRAAPNSRGDIDAVASM